MLRIQAHCTVVHVWQYDVCSEHFLPFLKLLWAKIQNLIISVFRKLISPNYNTQDTRMNSYEISLLLVRETSTNVTVHWSQPVPNWIHKELHFDTQLTLKSERTLTKKTIWVLEILSRKSCAPSRPLQKKRRRNQKRWTPTNLMVRAGSSGRPQSSFC